VTGSGHDQEAIASVRAVPVEQQYGVANVELLAWTSAGLTVAEEGLEGLKQRGAAKEGA
jgi:hypothetical protein